MPMSHTVCEGVRGARPPQRQGRSPVTVARGLHRDLPATRHRRAEADAHLEDAPVVDRGHRVLAGAGGQRHRALEGAVLELRMAFHRPAVGAVHPDAQRTVHHGDLDLPLRVHTGQLRPHDVGLPVDALLDADPGDAEREPGQAYPVQREEAPAAGGGSTHADLLVVVVAYLGIRSCCGCVLYGPAYRSTTPYDLVLWQTQWCGGSSPPHPTGRAPSFIRHLQRRPAVPDPAGPMVI